MNPILVTCIFKDSYSFCFNDKVIIDKNKSYICSGWMKHNLYLIKSKMYSLLNTELNNNSKILKLLNLIRHVFGIRTWVILE